MYLPPHFEMQDLPVIHEAMEAVGLANLITWSGTELLATPLPLILVRDEGEFGTLYGHVAKANPQGNAAVTGEALALFAGADAYITPSWYATKQETGKVVPTWNYETIHAYGVPEFFQDEARLLDLVTRLTQHHEGRIGGVWQVSDAPEGFIRSQLRGIVGFRMPIARLQGKRKMSQNRPLADREGVAAGLRQQGRDDVATLIPVNK
ncbi:FMN-binding negative transcriptional regulator [Terriglobus sp. RCC_193]|uniref:FMN-binding negative transcriptional regulator n=1 Tax=Terriglobus sp. RCC_193 TaxID=3239218 RepID=UPI003523F912